MKLPVALLLISLTLCCYSVTADTCPVLINILNKYLFGSLPEYMESIAPFVTSDVMKTAAYEFKGCVLKFSREHTEAIGELMKNILEKC
ncbi:secretoglobin family 1D member 2 [Chrysemys picta bellii]|uniref:secretoglobin family 1D member 2 n=1 Tax=Chrysemys picta bellii TaxID=8478 RepID=UPI0032B1C3FB